MYEPFLTRPTGGGGGREDAPATAGFEVDGGGPGGGWGRRTCGEGDGRWPSAGSGAHRNSACKVLAGTDGEGAKGGLPGPRTECNRCNPRAVDGVPYSCVPPACAHIGLCQVDLSSVRYELGSRVVQGGSTRGLSCKTKTHSSPHSVRSVSSESVTSCCPEVKD